jgi:hypothetical protein
MFEEIHKKEMDCFDFGLKFINNNCDVRIQYEFLKDILMLSERFNTCNLKDMDLNFDEFMALRFLNSKVFNGFSSGVKLILTGYHNQAALNFRNLFELVFLFELFCLSKEELNKWMTAHENGSLRNEFSADAVRKKLDKYKGLVSGKDLKVVFDLYSKISVHPEYSEEAQLMLKPCRNGLVITGPFMEESIIKQNIYEYFRLGLVAFSIIDFYYPRNFDPNLVRTNIRIKLDRMLGTKLSNKRMFLMD